MPDVWLVTYADLECSNVEGIFETREQAEHLKAALEARQPAMDRYFETRREYRSGMGAEEVQGLLDERPDSGPWHSVRDTFKIERWELGRWPDYLTERAYADA